MLAFVLVACGSSSNPAGGDGPHGGGDGPHNGGDGGGNDDAMVDAAPMLCGDGMRVRGEECDDHNTTSGDGCSSTCQVEAYSGAPQSAIDAMHAINALRAQADVPGRPLDPHAVQSSQAHADYYANNYAAVYGANPSFSPHQEMSGYPGFTGVNFYDRMTAAGFAGSAMFETMAFADNPQAAVSQWLNTVFHRIPMLHPDMGTFGYGNASAHANDVADYGAGTAEKQGAVIVWPPPNATGVPRSFNTQQEGPTPPNPPGGGTTTGPIVSVYFANGSNGTITSHSIKDAAGNTLPDTMIAKDDASFSAFMMGSYCFYAAGPAAAGATFTVSIAGTVNGAPFSTSWSFTTQ
jgi:cysteine-rich repeat protein